MTVSTRKPRKRSIPILLAAGLLVLAVAMVGFITTHAQALTTEAGEAQANEPNWASAEAAAGVANLSSQPAASNPRSIEVPPAAQDSCLHCHIAGSNAGMWTPLGRWALFGGFGLVFAFGVYRTTSVIATRSHWKPFTVRMADWVDERYEVREPLSKILSKPVPRFAMKWYYCLGGITAFLFVVQAVTGIMLAFYYRPTPEAAYASIQFIETQVRFGAAIRAIHSWSANGMVVVCCAHMMRVFITGSFKNPRELNWVSGVVLLVITFAFGFTGYLLPWDQRAYWASTVGTEIAGALPVIGDLALVYMRVGWDVAELTLSRFYGLHVIVLPIAILGFMLVHFMMIRRLGIAKPL